MLLLHQMVGGFYSPPSSWKIKALFTNLWHHAGLPQGCHLFLTFLSFSWPSLLSLLWLTFCFNFQLSTSPILACHCYVIGLQRQCHSTALGQHRDQLGSRGNSGCTRQETEWDLGPHVGHRRGQSCGHQCQAIAGLYPGDTSSPVETFNHVKVKGSLLSAGPGRAENKKDPAMSSSSCL